MFKVPQGVSLNTKKTQICSRLKKSKYENSTLREVCSWLGPSFSFPTEMRDAFMGRAAELCSVCPSFTRQCFVREQWTKMTGRTRNCNRNIHKIINNDSFITLTNFSRLSWSSIKKTKAKVIINKPLDQSMWRGFSGIITERNKTKVKQSCISSTMN